MRRTIRLGWSGTILLAGLMACSPKPVGGSPPNAGGNRGDSLDSVSSGREAAPSVRTSGGLSRTFQDSVGGTNHRFSPRQHEPRRLAAVPPPVAPHSLRRFVDGSRECFGFDRDFDYHPKRKGLGGIGSAPRTGQGFGSAYGRAVGAPSSGVSGGPRASSSDSATSSQPSPHKTSRPRAPQGVRGTSQRAPQMKPYATRGPSEAEEEPRMERRPSPEAEGGFDFGASIYLSNDDTMSLSSAQRLIYAIDGHAPVPRSHIRPHELLNYFSFHTASVKPTNDFSVVPSFAPNPEHPGRFNLGFSVQGRGLTKSTRRNINVSYVIDRSGSMAAEGRLEYVKAGILRSLEEMKRGDIIHLTLFDSNTCTLAENFMVGRDNPNRLKTLIRKIQPRGSTNLFDGLKSGYDRADSAYQPEYSNRVVMITDANANTGTTNERMIAHVGQHFDQRRIRLSGVGVGRDFNDSLLDQLTERGKGAYVFLGSDSEVDAVFGPRFVSLVETIANDVHFQVHLPPSLAMHTFYGEEASVIKERVQAIHYFAGTAQMFLSDVVSRDGTMPATDDVMFTIEYEDPETGKKRVEEFAWNIRSIAGESPNLKKALLVNRFATDLGKIAARTPVSYQRAPGTWIDPDASRQCATTRNALTQLGVTLSSDPEVARVRRLWDTYCGRYRVAELPAQGPRGPHNDFAPKDRWPSASR